MIALTETVVYSADIFEGKSQKAMRRFLGMPIANHFEDERAFHAFLKAAESLQDENLLASTLTRVRAFRPIPESRAVLDHDVAIFSGDELVFTCPKALLLELDLFKTMLNSDAEESKKVDGMHPFKFSYSNEVLTAFKKYIFGESLKGIAPNVLSELQTCLHMVSGQEKHAKVEKAILDYFLDDTHEFDEEYFRNNPDCFVNAFLKHKGINREWGQVKLSDFITLFQGKNSRLLQFILKKIDALRVDVTDFSALYLIDKSYRRQITNVVLNLRETWKITNISVLRKFFKNARVYATNVKDYDLGWRPTVEERVLLLSALQDLNMATQNLQDIVRENNDEATAQEALGDCLGRLGRYEEALPHLNKAIELNPTPAFAHAALGDCLRALSRFEEARSGLEIAVKRNPKSAFAHDRLAKCLRALGKYEQALPHLESAIALNPKSAFAYESLGNCLTQLGKYEQALPYLKDAIARNPMSYHAHMDLGECLRRLKRYEEALPYLKFEPTSAFAQERLGDCLRMLGEYEQALSHLERAIKLNPKSSFAYELYGDCLKALRRYAEGILYFQTALALYPESVFALKGLGDCLRRHGSYREAMPYLEKAIKIDPKTAHAREWLADCQKRIGTKNLNDRLSKLKI